MRSKALAAPYMAWMAIFTIVPLAVVAYYAFTNNAGEFTLDNLAQTYYRLGNDKAKAREFFDKAIEIKPTQIDTLYFLAQYDIEAGDQDAARKKLETAAKGRFSPLNYATREMVQSALDSL